MSIKSRQVAGVTSLVVVIVAALSAYHLATLARLSLTETASRGDMLRQAIYQRAFDVVPMAKDPYTALQQDGGIRALLESAAGYSPNVTYAAIVNRDGIAFAHSFKSEQGQRVPDQEDLTKVLNRSAFELLRALYSDQTFEVRQQLLFGEQESATIKIGISTLLVKNELQEAFRLAARNVVLALLISTAVAMLLAQWMLRPIHVIQSGLTRLGRGELDVRLELPDGAEFKDLGSSFDAVSAQLSESRAKALTSATDFESVVENLEDAVALFSPDGKLIFCNPAMATVLPQFATSPTRHLAEMAPEIDPIRSLIERTLDSHQPQGPLTQAEDKSGELLLMTHPIDDGHGTFVGAMLVARNLGFMTQVHSTLNYSRKLAALGRLMAGVAHEVKNPLNAMTIHLELLRSKIARAATPAAAAAGRGGPAGGRDLAVASPAQDITKHVDIIAAEIQRLDQVLNGFLRFARPDELKLQPVHLSTVVSDVVTTVTPEAEARRISVRHDCPRDLPEINADPAMIRQALLNLALNGCQAMADGGTLRINCHASGRRVHVDVEDTGVGIPPENLQKIFDLYFTTKEKGSGIGLSMVYRIVQLHDGEVEVQSTPGRGTRFRLAFPKA
ncbi:MAG TPA: ATP-binding protein [Vicinamibacterales bacterium]|nr:ATP-binding protein [Vicinamibacterales bacterium]